MTERQMQVLVSAGCDACEDFLRLWGEMLPSYPTITVRQIDVLTREGQELLVRHHIFALPGIVLDGVLLAKGPVDFAQLQQSLTDIIS